MERQAYLFNGQAVRTVYADGEVWFCVNDVGDILGLKKAGANCRKYLRREELRTFLSSKGECLHDCQKGTEENVETLRTAQKRMKGVNADEDGVEEEVGKRRHTLFTTESGVYAMVFRSEKKEAQEFRFWVTNTVLPSIRKTGSYTLPDALEAEEAAEDDVPSVSVSVTITGGIQDIARVLASLGLTK